MKWNYFAVLVRIGCALVSINFGECVMFPTEWSIVQEMFDSMEDLYPQSDHHAALARDALHRLNGGDIVYAEDAPMPEGSPTPESAAIKGNSYRWPGFPGKGRIPYRISKQLRHMKKKIYKAMKQYEKHTCIRFVHKKKKDKDYIFIKYGHGCSSFIGLQGGRQDVTFGSGCEYVGTIVHELGHVIGMFHEHQRYDRNKYIKVYKRNITPGQQYNFDKTPKSDQIIFTPYDYHSIMGYGDFAFSRSPGRLRTMRAKKKKFVLKEPFQKPGLDNMDIKQVNMLYEC